MCWASFPALMQSRGSRQQPAPNRRPRKMDFGDAERHLHQLQLRRVWQTSIDAVRTTILLMLPRGPYLSYRRYTLLERRAIVVETNRRPARRCAVYAGR
jgi:transposase